MNKLSRVTISLPSALLAAMDEHLAEEDETRSAVIRRLIEQALKDAKEKADIEQYIRAYREQPQTGEEFGWSDWATAESLRDLPLEEHK